MMVEKGEVVFDLDLTGCSKVTSLLSGSRLCTLRHLLARCEGQITPCDAPFILQIQALLQSREVRYIATHGEDGNNYDQIVIAIGEKEVTD